MSEDVCDPDVIDVVPKIFKELGTHAPEIVRSLAAVDDSPESVRQWAAANKLCSHVVVEYGRELLRHWRNEPDCALTTDQELWGSVIVFVPREGFEGWLADQPALIPGPYESLRSYRDRAIAFYRECQERGGVGPVIKDRWPAIDRHARWFVLNHVLGRSASDILTAEHVDGDESTIHHGVTRVAEVISLRTSA